MHTWRSSREASSEPAQRRFDGVEQRVLQQEVVDGVGGEAQLGKEHQVDPPRLALAHEDERFLAVGSGVADVDPGRACGDADQSLAMDGKEGIHTAIVQWVRVRQDTGEPRKWFRRLTR